MEVAGAHCLNLSYESKCSNTHGHNWVIKIEIRGEELNKEGMLLDFTVIKQIVNQLDHHNLNEILNFNPTAENIAYWTANQIDKKIEEIWPKVDEEGFTSLLPYVYEVSVQESKGNTAIWRKN
jgi:6-pyruvoyltetrahydropterin/6-carboxytetrahydropterin synthase